MATIECGNIYFRKYFIAVRKLTVAAPKCQPSEDEPPDHETGNFIFFYKWNTW